MVQAAGTPLSVPRRNKIPVDDYTALLNQVKKTLVEGQRRIEEEKVRIYWQTGCLIHVHILKNSERAQYGAEVDLVFEKNGRLYGVEVKYTQSKNVTAVSVAGFKFKD